MDGYEFIETLKLPVDVINKTVTEIEERIGHLETRLVEAGATFPAKVDGLTDVYGRTFSLLWHRHCGHWKICVHIPGHPEESTRLSTIAHAPRTVRLAAWLAIDDLLSDLAGNIDSALDDARRIEEQWQQDASSTKT